MKRTWFRLVAPVLLLAVAAAGCGDDGPSRLEPGIWLAITSPGSVERPLDDPAPIRVVDAVRGTERSFGPPASYVAVAWSPLADRLAAIGVDDINAENVAIFVRVWFADGRVAGNARFDGSSLQGLPNDIAWSPDGTRLLVRTLGGFVLLDAEAEQVGATAGTPFGGGGGRFGQREVYWAPDSQHAGDELNGLLLVADRDGKGAEYDLPPMPDGEYVSLVFRGWASPAQLRVITQDRGDVREVVGTLEPQRIAWGQGTAVDINQVYGVPDQAGQDRLNQLVPGRTLRWTKKSADGAVDVFALGEDSREGVATTLAVEFDGRLMLVDVGIRERGGAGGAHDVVVVPGWAGVAPDMVNAATPRPTAGPTPTERPFTPGPGASGGPGPAYPAPKGGRVPSLVADLPLYPGAREVDGFKVTGLERTGNVQMFVTPDAGAAVLEFFRTKLAALGFRATAIAEGPGPQSASYRRGRDGVTISTRYIPRPEDELPQDAVPYGYLSPGRFEPKINGEYFFFVVTLHAPEPR
ncbi:MAG: hypothetical protein ACKVT1_18730 [Dehalococcoidia bacterium]